MNEAPATDAAIDVSPGVDDDRTAPIQAILEALQGLRFGSVTVNVQDGVIVQLERIEKRRFGRSPRKN